MTIWQRSTDLDAIRRERQGTLMAHLDIEFTRIGDDFVEGTMPVDQRTHQPFGLLHGGASVALAETLGSFGANLVLDQEHYAVGLDINANHLRAVRSGRVTGIARPLHLGRSTQVWDIRIADADAKPVCIARLTMAVMAHRAPSNS